MSADDSTSILASDKADSPRSAVIYALCDAENRVRYVGKTIRSPRRRLLDHLCDKSNTYRGRWIRSVLKTGMRPVMITLETVAGDGCEAERRWIAHYRSIGGRLVNATDGGEGITMTAEIRAKIGNSKRGRKHTGKALENIRIGKRCRVGTRHSAETRAKMSKSQKVREPASAETRKRISDAKKGRPLSPEQRAFISENQKGRKLSAKTRAKMSAAQTEAWKKRRERETGTQLSGYIAAGGVPLQSATCETRESACEVGASAARKAWETRRRKAGAV